MFDLFFKITFQITSKQKWTKWNQILLAKRSCAGVSGPSDVPQFVRELMFKKPMGNQAVVRVLDDRVFARQISTSKTHIVRNDNFREIVESLYVLPTCRTIAHAYGKDSLLMDHY